MATGAEAQPNGAPGEQPPAGQVPSAPPEGAGAAATSPGQDPNGAPQGAGEGNEQIENPEEIRQRLETAEAEARRARDDAARFRRQLREREAEDRRRAAESQSDEERQAEEAQERESFEQERTQFRLERAMFRLAPDLNLVDPSDALWLLDWGQIDFDDEGEPTNLRDLTEDLLKRKPHLKRQAASPTPTPTAPTIGASSGAAVAGPPPALTAEELEYAAASGMTPERYAALKRVKTLDDYKKATPGPTA